MSQVLEVKNISKSFKDYRSEWQRIFSWFGLKTKPTEEHYILQDINFSVTKGESIGIVGKNGAGKSTLLKIITGTLKASHGSIVVNGKIGAILELGMGFHPDMTGRQNAFHSAGLMGYSLEEITNVINDIHDFSGIEEYFDQPARVYSSGMQARVAFAVATAFRPDILIVDEALSVGDAFFQTKCYERIARFKGEGTVLFLVTHSIDDIVKHCTRALFIKDGKIELDGSPKDVSNRYLDELFGKQSSKKPVDKPTNILDSISKGIHDLYYTRPGYNKEEYKWGHGGAQILDYVTYADGKQYPQTIDSKSETEFHFKVLLKDDYEDLTIGFLIKTHDGVYIYGTNSHLLLEGKKKLSAKKDSIHFYKFILPMNLNAGHYLISIGISTGPQNKLIPLERRYDSILINVNRTIGFSGLLDLEANFEEEQYNA